MLALVSQYLPFEQVKWFSHPHVGTCISREEGSNLLPLAGNNPCCYSDFALERLLAPYLGPKESSTFHLGCALYMWRKIVGL
jgi:hypothetical protein